MEVTKKNALKAYKVFNPDFKCRGFQFEMGKEYKHVSNVEICRSGYHSCLVANDCFDYYDFNINNKVAEVLIWGTIDSEKDGDSKRCSSHIKLIREIEWNEVLSIVNVGSGNTGRSNTGYSNTGYSNTGYSNTGNWNNCNLETGHFNSIQSPTIRIFNQPCDVKCWEAAVKPDFICFDQSEWVYSENMTDEEKVAYPNHATTGGYLKVYSYKDAFRNSLNSAKKERNWRYQYQLLVNLPNFDAKVFEEISGINIEEEK